MYNYALWFEIHVFLYKLMSYVRNAALPLLFLDVVFCSTSVLWSFFLFVHIQPTTVILVPYINLSVLYKFNAFMCLVTTSAAMHPFVASFDTHSRCADATRAFIFRKRRIKRRLHVIHRIPFSLFHIESIL